MSKVRKLRDAVKNRNCRTSYDNPPPADKWETISTKNVDVSLEELDKAIGNTAGRRDFQLNRALSLEEDGFDSAAFRRRLKASIHQSEITHLEELRFKLINKCNRRR